MLDGRSSALRSVLEAGEPELKLVGVEYESGAFRRLHDARPGSPLLLRRFAVSRSHLTRVERWLAEAVVGGSNAACWRSTTRTAATGRRCHPGGASLSGWPIESAAAAGIGDHRVRASRTSVSRPSNGLSRSRPGIKTPRRPPVHNGNRAPRFWDPRQGRADRAIARPDRRRSDRGTPFWTRRWL